MGDIAVADIAADRVHAYIAGAGPVTRFWHRKCEVLRGFYRYAMARGYTASAPLPKIIPKPPQFVPYIFSHEELQRLLALPTITVEQAALILGLSRNPAYDAVKNKEIPSIRIGRSIKIPTAALRQMLHLGGVK